MEKGRMPRPGEIYNHFKDKPYQIITVAIHSETSEPMVVYQALYGDFKTYVRSLEMFLSEVDHVKYPEIKQKYRFELRSSQDKMLDDILVQGHNKINSKHLEDNKIQFIDQPLIDRANQLIEKSFEDKTVQSIEKLSEDKTDQFIGKHTELFSDRVVIVSDENIIIESVEGSVNAILLRFLDAESYSRKLDVITSNVKHLNDRLINDMAVSLDCAVDEGPLDQRIQGLIHCLQAMCRFEDKRLR
jgi:hypothetical protein